MVTDAGKRALQNLYQRPKTTTFLNLLGGIISKVSTEEDKPNILLLANRIVRFYVSNQSSLTCRLLATYKENTRISTYIADFLLKYVNSSLLQTTQYKIFIGI